ncbi:hypothetical protein PENANT_c025G03299 [Penicillium antarcticum]|uniref:Uncharacterized protein n=1 Tax=Penicillium antarcticum TaxID=416450 RepID=A0A1V6PXW3_9EURO|nr:hypothetical protein PENANT_c025G03299 [Penicillium antarcticum]
MFLSSRPTPIDTPRTHPRAAESLRLSTFGAQYTWIVGFRSRERQLGLDVHGWCAGVDEDTCDEQQSHEQRNLSGGVPLNKSEAA